MLNEKRSRGPRAERLKQQELAALKARSGLRFGVVLVGDSPEQLAQIQARCALLVANQLLDEIRVVNAAQEPLSELEHFASADIVGVVDARGPFLLAKLLQQLQQLIVERGLDEIHDPYHLARRSALEGRSFGGELPALSQAEYRERQKLTAHTLRHGPTNYNLQGRMQGNQQSEIVPEQIHGYFERVGASSIPQPELIIVSGLIRTRQTAEELRKYNHWPENLPIIEHPELNERKWGIFEGHTKQQVQEILRQRNDIAIPPPLTLEQVRHMDDTQPLIDVWEFKPPEAESMWEVQARIQAGLINLRRLYSGRRILLISHLGALASQQIEAGRVSHIEIIRQAEGQTTVSNLTE